MEELRYSVPGMSCSHCDHAISSELAKVAGVTAVDVDLDAKVVRVRGEVIDDAAVRAAIADAGYEAVAA
jgi:copper chaperone CopZ